MNVYEKKVIEKSNDPTAEYKYNAQIWKSLDGKSWAYYGNGKYFRTYEEAEVWDFHAEVMAKIRETARRQEARLYGNY